MDSVYSARRRSSNFHTFPRGMLATAALGLMLSGCGGGSSSGDDSGDTVETGTPELRAQSEIMAVDLQWSGEQPVDIRYSSDPDCDWANYSLCDDSGELSGVEGGSAMVKVHEQDVRPSLSYFFVAVRGEQTSEVTGAMFAPPTPGGPRIGDMVATDDSLIIGGFFDRFHVPVRGGGTVDIETGRARGALPSFNAGGVVSAVIPDGEQGWYLGGDFNTLNGHERHNLVRVRSNGAVHRGWAPRAGANGTDEAVYGMARDGSRIFIGGDFTEMEGTLTRQGLAAVDADNGDVLSWAPSVRVDDTTPGRVHDLAYHNGKVYVAGDFAQVRGHGDGSFTARTGLVRFDAETGALDEDWHPTPDDTVRAVIVADDRLFLGGDFMEVAGDDQRRHATAVDLTNGEPVNDWTPRPDGNVHALARDGDRIYVGGAFEELNTLQRPGLVALKASNGALDNDFVPEWTILPPDESPFSKQPLRELAVVDGVIYAGGVSFFSGDERVWPDRLGLVAYDASGQVMDWNGGPGRGTVHAMAANGSDLYIGGSVGSLGAGVERRSLAEIDLETGMLTDWSPEVDESVSALSIDQSGDRLYLGGLFSEVNGEQRRNIARLDLNASEGDQLNSDWNPGTDDGVRALETDGQRLYAGGVFEHVGGGDGEAESEQALARFELDGTGAVIPTGSSVQFDHSDDDYSPQVRSLLSHGDKVYVGGRFDNAFQGDDVCNLMRFKVSDGEPDGGWEPCVDNDSSWAPSVSALAISGTELVVGGTYTKIREAGDGDCDSADCADRNRLAAISIADAGVYAGWGPDVTYATVNSVDTDADGNVFITGDGTAEIEDAGHPFGQFARDGDDFSHVAGWGQGSGISSPVLVHEGRAYIGRGRIFELDAETGRDAYRFGLVVVDTDTGEYVW